MNIFPTLEETVEFGGTLAEAAAILRDIIEAKKNKIFFNYTLNLYGKILDDGAICRPSHTHGGYYWIFLNMVQSDHVTLVKVTAAMPTWRKFAYTILLSITIVASVLALFLVPSAKDLHIATYPLIFAFLAWSGKRDDFNRCKSGISLIREKLQKKSSANAT